MNSTPSEEILPRKSTYAILYSQAANVIASFAANRRRTKTARSCSIMRHRGTSVLVPRSQLKGAQWKRSNGCECRERADTPLAIRRFAALDHRRGGDGRRLLPA